MDPAVLDDLEGVSAHGDHGDAEGQGHHADDGDPDGAGPHVDGALQEVPVGAVAQEGKHFGAAQTGNNICAEQVKEESLIHFQLTSLLSPKF